MLLSLNFHYSFNAAVVLLLSRLLGLSGTEKDFDDVDFLCSHLESMAQSGRGNESAFDCRRMVIEFKAVVMKLRNLSRSTSMTGENLLLTPSASMRSVSIGPMVVQDVPPIAPEFVGAMPSRPSSRIEPGEAYQDLVSYLKDDLHQQPTEEAWTGSVSWV